MFLKRGILYVSQGFLWTSSNSSCVDKIRLLTFAAASVQLLSVTENFCSHRSFRTSFSSFTIFLDTFLFSQLQKQFELNDQSGSLSMMYMTSHHVAPWPSKNSCPETTEE